tara:strand:- start:500 stop:1750 length:1251 start_codon:yes stop_codon:yes gene_type:complete
MRIDIIGTGYVGLTLGIALSRTSHEVVCWDINKNLIDNLKKGITDVEEPFINEYLQEGREKNNLIFKHIDEGETGEFCIVSVGTSIKDCTIKSRMSSIENIIQNLINCSAKYIVLRSTVSVGLTRRFHKLWGEKVDFIYAPERTVEGCAIEELGTLPQIIAFNNSRAKQKAIDCFSELGVELLMSDTWEEAELAKLLCNTYRDYNFAFSNQAAFICRSINLDIYKVNLLASHDYDRFPSLKPGPVSGPCLTKDTKILSSSFENCSTELLEKARDINSEVNKIAVRDIKRIIDIHLIDKNKILIVGLGFKSKPPTGDTRDSHSIDIALTLIEEGYEISYYDPLVDTDGKNLLKNRDIEDLEEKDFDLVIFPITPSWVLNKIEDPSSKINNAIRYWLYKPNNLQSNNKDYFFGDYRNF